MREIDPWGISIGYVCCLLIVGVGRNKTEIRVIQAKKRPKSGSLKHVYIVIYIFCFSSAFSNLRTAERESMCIRSLFPLE